MEAVAPTRDNLLRLKASKDSLISGREILKTRREALIKEFLSLVDDCIDSREKLKENLSHGQNRIEFLKALKGEEVKSFSIAEKRHFTIDSETKNLWGITVTELSSRPVVKGLKARKGSTMTTSPDIIETAKDFEKIVSILIDSASKEIKLTRLGEVLRSDSSRINALGEILIPRIGKRIKEIERVLDEREREEVLRIKHFKKRSARQG